MDKFEYKVRADEIKELISRGEYAQAADIADTIDWRRVKSVMMLCTISDLYKINRRYEDARDMLLLAYERRPGGRTICYSLCELSIKMEEFVQAVEYYKEFVQVAPKDPSRYILQYKLYEAQDVSLEERIAVLEELKKRDYREKWAYELAYLYHRVGLGARCVEECDELILWFGEGKYVVKAMELKMLHEPLTPQQQRRYMSRFATSTEEQLYQEPAEEPAQEDVQQLYHQPRYEYQQQMDYPSQTAAEAAPEMMYGQTSVEPEATVPAQQPEEMDIQVKTMDMGQYNTINLQAELAAGLKEVLKSEQPSAYAEDPVMRSIMAPMMDSDTESLDYPEIDEVSEDDLEPDAGVIETSEVFFGETAEIGDLQQEPLKQEQLAPVETDDVAAVVDNVVEMLAMREEEEAEAEEAVVWDAIEEDAALQEVVAKESATVPDVTAEIVMEQLRQEITGEPGGEEKPAPQPAVHVEPPKAYASVLSQESDGQLSLVMPESESIEKQITGQMSIEDILAEWERMKKENQEKRAAEVRQHVLQHTGSMFTEFEAAVRDGLLEKLEQQKDKGANIDIVVDSDSDEIEELEEIIDVQELEDEPAEQPASVVTEAFVNVVEEQEAAEEAVMAEEAAEEEPAATEERAAEEPIAVEVESVMEQEQPAAEAEPIVTETASAAAQEPVEEQPALAEQAPMPQTEEIVRDKVKVRSLTREEKELFGPYIQSRAAREQLAKCIDSISLASYTGNVIITGAEGMDTMTLAKNIIREIQLADPNFSGKVAKISGASLNHKSVADTIDRLKNGALIISRASDMNGETVMEMYKILQKENLGIVIVLEDIKKAMDKFLAENEQLQTCFTARMDVEPLSNDRLVAFGRQYAREREFSIDDLGILALHTRIEELQTLDHAVTVVEVTEIIEEAIRHVKRKTLGHFFDILFARRYDDEDMIILTEKDFV